MGEQGETDLDVSLVVDSVWLESHEGDLGVSKVKCSNMMVWCKGLKGREGSGGTWCETATPAGRVYINRTAAWMGAPRRAWHDQTGRKAQYVDEISGAEGATADCTSSIHAQGEGSNVSAGQTRPVLYGEERMLALCGCSRRTLAQRGRFAASAHERRAAAAYQTLLCSPVIIKKQRCPPGSHVR